MNVLIKKEIFDSAKTPNQKFELSFLLNLILYKERYKLILHENISSCTYVQELNDNEKNVLEECFISTNIASLTEDCTIANDGDTYKDDKIFTVSEGIIYLMQPLSILVENSLNDAHFIRAIMRCYDVRNIFKNQEKEMWVQFENAGGCTNVINFLKGRVEYFQNKPKFLRCYVLVDGDKKYKSEVIKKYDKLKNYLNECRIKYHILEKRCMENYVPQDAIEENKNTRNWLNAYKNLSQEQRDFINIGNGFCGDLIKEEKEEFEKKIQKRKNKNRKYIVLREILNRDINNFYVSVSNTNFGYLAEGIKLPCFKTRFPKFFDNDVKVYKKVFDEMLKYQTDKHELENIKNEIISLI